MWTWSGRQITALLIRVVVVDAMCQLAWIFNVPNGAMLPIFVVHEAAPEVEGVIDISEVELDVVMLSFVSKYLPQ